MRFCNNKNALKFDENKKVKILEISTFWPLTLKFMWETVNIFLQGLNTINLRNNNTSKLDVL